MAQTHDSAKTLPRLNNQSPQDIVAQQRQSSLKPDVDSPLNIGQKTTLIKPSLYGKQH